ncbi:MAG TPA: hypothetical protein VE242_05635, partial [Chthoniobacterales bacterium]|nr:hypothetical protein [Chthoniobacterales bacterium]
SKIFIATALEIAISSIGAASNRAPQIGKCMTGHEYDEAFQQLDKSVTKALVLIVIGVHLRFVPVR